MSAAPEKIYLTPEELSERFEGKISTRTLSNWRSQGNGPPFTKVGGAILYPLRDLEEWEANRTVENTSQYKRT